MRIVSFALAATLIGLTPILLGESLGAVLTANKLPRGILSENERQHPITSFAASTELSPFLLAYYDDDGSGGLLPLLHILRYDRQTGHLRRTDLRGIEIPSYGRSEVMTQVSSNCMGSALNISEKGGLIVIHTNISPSAECALILTSDLNFVAGLGGWVLATIDGNLIFEENTIHFAPTHPAQICAYNLRQKKLTSIYPAETDAARTQFSAELHNHMASSKWCNEQNNPCDPENFSTNIEHITVNESHRSFAFDARMDPEGFGEEAERSIKPKTIHYTCGLKDDKWLLTSK
ncbi:MAG TPA: hypothetical protein VIX42_02415 [Edaphobacter sp.]